jgi:hypothetical protein
MPWPISQDYNEAVQTPLSSFTDPELKGGEVALNAMGLPIPCSGNFADVYQFQGASGSKWAVECFTREIPGLRERYVEVSKYLAENQLPFMVEFKFLQQGIRIRGQWYPVLKMNWVEGYTLNQFVRHALDKPKVLHTLCQIWVKMAVKMREARLAHCDLQHGNVLLVPAQKGASLGVRLVDYDGMCVPALDLLKSIELGHPNFQHPQRLREGTYGLEVDRFSHLVIYTALRALAVAGKALWDKYDNGDNLLFRQRDFEAPARSALFADLLRMEKPIRDLAGTLIDASKMRLEQAPLLEDLVPVQPVTEIKPKPATITVGETLALPESAPETNPFAEAFADAEVSAVRSKRQAARRPLWPWLAAGGGVVAVLLIVLIAVVGGKKDSNQLVNNPFKPPIGKGGKPPDDDKNKKKPDDHKNKKNIDHDRAVAQWALERGAQVSIECGVENWKSVNRVEELPDQPFSVKFINFYQPGKLTDDDMRRIRDLPKLETLMVVGQPITGTGLGHLKNVPRLGQLILNNSHIADDDLIHLKNLPQLMNLDLAGTRVSNKGLVHLEGCTNLRILSLDRTAVSNKGLSHLEGLTNLTSLNVDHTAVDDDGLIHLQKLVQLNNLTLGKVSDMGLAHLEGLAKLRFLNLSAPVGPLSNLGKLQQLRFLSLRGAAVDDNVLTHVKALPKLDALTLLETHVSDAGLVHLQELKSLKNVYLLNNHVTQDGANKLKAAIAICRIQLNGQEVLFNNQWDDLRLVGTTIKDDVLQMPAGAWLTTKKRYQGPIEVQLQVRSSNKKVSLTVYKIDFAVNLPNPDGWHNIRFIINKKNWEAWAGNELRFRQAPPPSWKFFPDSIRIAQNGNDALVEIKSLGVKDLAGPVQVVQPKDPKKPVLVKQKSRLPVPTAKEIAAADKKLRATYPELFGKDDFNSRQRLLSTMLNLARNANEDSALCFAALSQARDLAARNCNSRAVFETIHQLQDAFDIDTVSHLVRVMELALFNKDTVVENIFLIGLKSLDEAKNADQFGTAKLVALTRSAALRFPKDASSPIMLAVLANKEKLLKKIEEEYKKVKPLFPKAQADSGDTKAQKAVGRYCAFIKGDWQRGLPHLALCGEEALVALAERDLKNPQDAQDRADLANAWRVYADKAAGESTLAKTNIRQRAKTWALRAVAGLPEDGKAQVEDCLKISYGGKKYLKPGLVADFFQGPKLIRKRIDHSLDFKDGFSKDDKIPPNGFAARWSGFLWISEPGMYHFFVKCYGTFAVKVDNKEVFSSTKVNNQISTMRFLVEGLHPVEIQYQNLLGNANFRLGCSLSFGRERDSQKVLLYHVPRK